MWWSSICDTTLSKGYGCVVMISGADKTWLSTVILTTITLNPGKNFELSKISYSNYRFFNKSKFTRYGEILTKYSTSLNPRALTHFSFSSTWHLHNNVNRFVTTKTANKKDAYSLYWYWCLEWIQHDLLLGPLFHQCR